MASEPQVRQYLAYWFQLGKRVYLRGGAESMLPAPVIAGDRYSAEFEACWARIQASESGDCYLEGAPYTITDLLSHRWDIADCARCSMPVPMPVAGIGSPECPCSDLEGWPNTEIPMPRAPVQTQAVLKRIHARLGHSEDGDGASVSAND